MHYNNYQLEGTGTEGETQKGRHLGFEARSARLEFKLGTHALGGKGRVLTPSSPYIFSAMVFHGEKRYVRSNTMWVSTLLLLPLFRLRALPGHACPS